MSKRISKETIEALSRNFFKEASSYGFKYEHYLSFVNSLLEYAIEFKNGTSGDSSLSEKPKFEAIKYDALPIESRNVKIRRFVKFSDYDLLAEWLKDDYGQYFLLSLATTKSINIDELLDSKHNEIGIITTHEGTPIGLMAFLYCDYVQHKAELRKLIGVPEMRGKGLGKEATQLWIKYGHTGLHLKKIYLNTIDTNLRNIKLNEELGFKVEGILRNESLIDGEYHDVLRMGLWRE
ncbi:MAG: GNAT family N-acetyltransferase [Bacteroidetes bacterium]|nr:GNAT family N-acetyltransferase [Bacteroidota bacterium]MBU1677858.1 GNAT family N-acetyltransferase [Bacteroidota bacterium]MBU2505899.1 GNAT family N-acetyltransferase [Bacteroidota bacterium]